MKLMCQLAFGGNCREAFEHYERVFSARIVVMNTFGGNEDKALPAGSASAGTEKIRFAELHVGDQALLGNDVPAEQFKIMQGFNVSVHIQGKAEARSVFSGLADGGQVTTPLAKVDWAALFGMVTDRFGVPWLILALQEGD